jgi:DNA polymerase III alpha subunit
MIPLFKSDYSIGKSILKITSKANSKVDSVFEIAKEEGLTTATMVEDCLTGFLSATRASKNYGIDLIFGLRLTCCDSRSKKEAQDCHKIIIFAKNDEGCKLLNKIFSKAFELGGTSIEINDLKKLWQESALLMAIPFYDSFIYNNLFKFSQCMPLFSFTKPIFLEEDNMLPFDSIIKDAIHQYCKKNKFETLKTKSIYYKNRSDFEAFQTYKCICNRGSWQGKTVSLEKPNLDHCGSREFCIESWRECK